MNKNKVYAMLSSLYGIGAILIFWQMLHLYIGANMVPSPIDTLERFIYLIQNDFYLHIIYSFYRIASSIIISLFIGVPIGMIIGMSKRVSKIVSPIIYLLYPIPKIAFLPIFMVLFGIGDLSKIILMVTIIIFQVIISTRDSILEIDKTILMSSKIMRFTNFDLAKEVILPAISQKVFSAIRISVGIAISALFFSENYATKYGIGYFIMNSWSMVDYKDMFAGVVALSIMALVIYKSIDFVEKKACPWITIK